MSQPFNFCLSALTVIETEAKAVFNLKNSIDETFNKACELLLQTKGRIVVMGMGKSGHIARKIAATLSSTGTPAFFLHPAEASHGDMGMITASDTIIAISYSGITNEITVLLPLIARLNIPLLALTGNSSSLIAKAATIHFNIAVEQEACPLGLAPTTSTTVSLVMGDALAIALLQARGFNEQDFARSHPGGKLGRRLLLRISELSHTHEALPIVSETTLIRDALIEVNNKKLGMTCVVDENGILTGIFTDGDIRRTLLKNEKDIYKTYIKEVMTPHAITVNNELLAVEAITLMNKHNITVLVIVDEEHHPMGVVHLHDLLRAGIL